MAVRRLVLISTALAGCFSTPAFHGVNSDDVSGDDAGSGSNHDAASVALSANVVFVAKLPGGGLTAAGSLGALDTLCTSNAASAGIAGDFVAWFSLTTAPAESRLPPTGGWVRPDNKPFALSKAALLRGEILYPARLDASGQDLAVTLPVMTMYTGTNDDGTAGQNCFDLTFPNTNPGPKALTGHSDGAKGSWTHEEDAACNQNGYIYCFQTNRPEVPDPPPATIGRAAFVTFADANVSMGLSTLDGQCQSVASDQSKHYRAFVSTELFAANASARFTVDGLPWVRPDHVVVTTDLVDFGAAISQLTNGSYSDGFYVVSGAADPTMAGSEFTTCKNYSSTASGDHYFGGKNTRSGSALFGKATDAMCSDPAKLYCLQYD